MIDVTAAVALWALLAGALLADFARDAWASISVASLAADAGSAEVPGGPGVRPESLAVALPTAAFACDIIR
eukprot:CAMPEP_0181489874 /NCGR_PEP_ID=MMETSP1110-20121109/49238_1 /TAXON_ID=174948 /ORGANISM="Symbiodinium sp., Strain CCMP421" /LENGTH=70 /DNA_ID=CAMNT_0023616783 /DNA_START=82 /DNA_END=292 /DNA_ORIENTATION=-